MYAIVTRFHGCTNSKPSRIIASVAGNTRTRTASVTYSHLSGDDDHIAARNAWIEKHCKPDHVFVTCASRIVWHIGTLPNGDTVHVAELKSA